MSSRECVLKRFYLPLKVFWALCASCDGFILLQKKKVCCFYAFSLCCGTPDDPAVAPAEAGHCEGGGVGGRGRRAKKEQSEACKDISVNLPKLVKKMTGA